MSSKIRHLDDASNTTDTLLTLPRSDFPQPKRDALPNANADAQEDEDRLLLVRLPANLPLSELTQGYILGDTSDSDIIHSSNANGQSVREEEKQGNIHVPIPTRLIIEGQNEGEGKTLELMRVETSNTYILVPPMTTEASADQDTNGSNKRQKTENGDAKKLTTMPARSVGLIPGEESPACFFLEPVPLMSGHYASKLRWATSRWVYDPLDPPECKFGYSLSELSHICRTSESEIGYALKNRVNGAEDALVIPVNESDEKRYGNLSEEGRQTISMAILSALLESDVDLSWYFDKDNQSKDGMDLSLLMTEVRTQWHKLEEDGVINKESQDTPVLTDSKHETQSESQSQFFTPAEFHKIKSGKKESVLADEVIWHCLRPMVHHAGNDHKDSMPKTVWLLPDEVAKLAAHNVFLKSSSDGWKEADFMESWNMRMPSISKYEPSVKLLQGIALFEVKTGEDGGTENVWQYFPEAGLSLVPSLRIKSMFAMRNEWTLTDALPYLSKFVLGGATVDVESEVKSLLEKHAKATSSGDADGVKYVAK